jgi:uridine nucleosidase
LHDPLAVAAALYPALFDAAGGERFQVEIVTEGVHDEEKKYVGQLGRTKAVLVGKGEEGVRIPRALEVGGFWELVEGALGRAGSVTPMRGEEWEWRAREAVVGIVEGDGV